MPLLVMYFCQCSWPFGGVSCKIVQLVAKTKNISPEKARILTQLDDTLDWFDKSGTSSKRLVFQNYFISLQFREFFVACMGRRNRWKHVGIAAKFIEI